MSLLIEPPIFICIVEMLDLRLHHVAADDRGDFLILFCLETPLRGSIASLYATAHPMTPLTIDLLQVIHSKLLQEGFQRRASSSCARSWSLGEYRRTGPTTTVRRARWECREPVSARATPRKVVGPLA
jgi:hypothetical protein